MVDRTTAAGKSMSKGPAAPPTRWPRSLAVLHWVTVLLLIPLFWSGWAGGVHASTSGLHISLGASLFVVLLARLAIRAGAAPPPPVDSRPLVWMMARGIQFFLYASLLAAGVTGVLAVSSHPFTSGPRLFGTIELGRISPASVTRASAGAHGYLIWLILAAALLHVAGAILHSFRGRQIIRRML